MSADEGSNPPNLPPYSEMILAAISALGEREGSSKSSISKQIESTYGELPRSHSSLLTSHLLRMKDSGELIMLKSNYLRPEAGAPPKRGRARPPKPKPPTDADHVAPPRLLRGRPPKNKEPLVDADAGKEDAVDGEEDGSRPRGRPVKKVRTADAEADPVKRGRGRPPKAKPAAETV